MLRLLTALQVQLADFGLVISMEEEPPVSRLGTLDYMVGTEGQVEGLGVL